MGEIKECFWLKELSYPKLDYLFSYSSNKLEFIYREIIRCQLTERGFKNKRK